MRRSLLFALVLVASMAACSGARPGSSSSFALGDVWNTLHTATSNLEARNSSACNVTFGSWFVSFGVRGLACAANEGVPLHTVIARAGSLPVWASGPHSTSGEVFDLDLTSERSYGRYNGAFVRWAAAQAVPTRAEDIEATSALYQTYGQRLARVYWLTLGDLQTEGYPASLSPGPAKQYLLYLRGGATPVGAEGYEGGISVYGLFEAQSQRIVPQIASNSDNEWEVLYEVNTAYGFWLRRSEDGTWTDFKAGLESVLRTYDSAWLAQHPIRS